MLRIIVILAAVLLAAALVVRTFTADSRLTPAPSSATGAMTHPREGAMYHQPYTSTR